MKLPAMFIAGRGTSYFGRDSFPFSRISAASSEGVRLTNRR
jgi:hypothetical protein